MKNLSSIKEIDHLYDTFLIDQWGVMHDGKNGYTHAIDVIKYLEKKNKNLIIISNSSKRSKSSSNRLPKLGFNQNSFIKILTSGELIWNTLHDLSFKNLKNKKCLHIYDQSKEDGLNFRDGLDNIIFVDDIEKADFILACTPYANSKPIDYIPMLKHAIEKEIIMYCANPDFQTIESKNNQNTYCMGVIGEMYSKMGGEVILQGKPEIDIYLESTKLINLDKSRTVAVGDSLFHDIKGAENFEIDNVLVTSGIHDNLQNIQSLMKNHHINPTYLIEHFNL